MFAALLWPSLALFGVLGCGLVALFVLRAQMLASVGSSPRLGAEPARPRAAEAPRAAVSLGVR